MPVVGVPDCLSHQVRQTIENPDCSSFLCNNIGYFDDWKAMGEYRICKQYLALCVCLQLFKITKFTSQLVPKMGLMSNVLRHAAIDIFFFALVFFNSLLAFSTMLYVQVRVPLSWMASRMASLMASRMAC